jgi:hypothetical protein
MAASSFYVERVAPTGRIGWTGPIRSERQARREADAWRGSGWSAVVRPTSPEVRAKVRAWEKAKRRTASAMFESVTVL